MLDQSTRVAILRLREEGTDACDREGLGSRGRGEGRPHGRHDGGARAVARRVPTRTRSRSWSCSLDARQPRAGAREIVAAGAKLSYPALTAYCRRHGIGHDPPMPVGQYHFDPRRRRSTTPRRTTDHRRKKRRAQTASMALCYSRMLFFQLYPRLHALRVQGVSDGGPSLLRGRVQAWMIDNTHIVVMSGTGETWCRCRDGRLRGALRRVFEAHEKGTRTGRRAWSDPSTTSRTTSSRPRIHRLGSPQP